MAEVTWNLPDEVTVIYSSLMIPDCERDELNREVAAFRIRDYLNLDVEWNVETSQYVVTLFTDDIESPIDSELYFDDAFEMKRAVEELAFKYAGLSESPKISGSSD